MAITTPRAASPPAEFWLFGYGSLIWKPPPHYDRRVPGWVTGYVRRFWQASEDHRGTPQAPGRVVTLIQRSYWEQLADHHRHATEQRVWGVAYRIVPARVAEVKDYLDIREINGYSIHYTPFHPADGAPPIRTLAYIGTPDNPQFVGPQHPDALARHILASRGPSGPNKEYLYNLDTALKELGPESGDFHVGDLADRARALERSPGLEAPDAPGSEPGPGTGTGTAKTETATQADAPFRHGTSTAELEEIEKL